MSQYTATQEKTFLTGEAIARGALVKIASGVITAAGLTENAIGVMLEATASGAYGTVRLFAPTILCKASAAITQGAVVYGRASGLVDDASGSSAVQVGIALEAATAANDIIEVVPKT